MTVWLKGGAPWSCGHFRLQTAPKDRGSNPHGGKKKKKKKKVKFDILMTNIARFSTFKSSDLFNNLETSLNQTVLTKVRRDYRMDSKRHFHDARDVILTSQTDVMEVEDDDDEKRYY